MAKDNRDLLELLRSELAFLESGGYRESLRVPWRPQFIFEDSPTCMNYDRKEAILPCSECALMQFVPPDCREEKIPCRHIPLNAEGYTIDTYYRIGTHEELEAALSSWLRETIRRLKRKRAEQVQEFNGAKPLSVRPVSGRILPQLEKGRREARFIHHDHPIRHGSRNIAKDQFSRLLFVESWNNYAYARTCAP